MTQMWPTTAAAGAAALLALAACAPATPMPTAEPKPIGQSTPSSAVTGRTAADQPSATCAAAGPAVTDRLTAELTVAGGGTLSQAVYAPVAPPRPDESGWFAVAATLEGPGLDALEVLWVTDANLPADDPDGVWFAMDDMAREFSVHSLPPEGLGWSAQSPDLAAVRACLR